MPAQQVSPGLMNTLRALQQREITEYHIYKKIAAGQKNPHNREVLERIAEQELGHYALWKRHTQQDVTPVTSRIWFYYVIAWVFGMTFAIKLMEGVEKRVQVYDQALIDQVPEAREIRLDGLWKDR